MNFYSSDHMKPHGCRYLLLPSKKIHISYALPYGHEKRGIDFFIVASTLVATKWLLMLGNFETLGSKFRHETVGLLPSFATISKNPHHIRTPIKSQKKRKKGQALLDLPITFLEITF